MKKLNPSFITGFSRNYSLTNDRKDLYNPVKFYINAYDMRVLILKENKAKTGIYKWTNKLNNECYIGSSINLWRRFLNYFNLSYLSSVKNNLRISRALIKYGYANFSLEILEYCEKSVLLKREQYYLDLLKPEYNIEKIAGSSLGLKHSKETRAKISKSLKGVYVGSKSSLFGKTHDELTKSKMSGSKLGKKNSFYGKTHSEETKSLMSSLKLGKKHLESTKDLISKKKGILCIYMKKTQMEF
uniref:GIY-YIG domain-containing protein n=1 Tax=Dactylella tenuis TaxID=383872 RepID=A0A4Y5N008_9PEZI|nr:hypothetical protein [Dactylella tenuis]QCW06858.1 hypothetical protein [Dactylella tenuis]